MKINTLFFLLVCAFSVAQEKTTGILNLSNNFTASLTLNNSTSMATLTLSGPNDRWFSVQFGSFESGMQSGSDVVYWNNSILVDGFHNGVNFAPTPDSVNDWVLVSNQNDSPTIGVRTLVYKRPFDTGDSNDYVFNFDDSDIDFAWARSSSSNFTMNYHGVLNRDVFLDAPLNLLGVNDVFLADTKLYPNPTNGNVTIIANSIIHSLNIYSQTGSFIKTFYGHNGKDLTVDISALAAGIYFFEIQGDVGKYWKKVQLTF